MTPGSPTAISCGCICDQLANNYGIGTVIGTRRVFAVDDGCIVHGSFKWHHPHASVATTLPMGGSAPATDVIVYAVNDGLTPSSTRT